MSVHSSVGVGAGLGGETLKAASYMCMAELTDVASGRPSLVKLRSSLFERSASGGRSVATNNTIDARSLSPTLVSSPTLVAASRQTTPFEGAGSAASESTEFSGAGIEASSVYGLYVNFVLNGFINGFFAKYIMIPTCFYVFGPVGPGGNVSYSQCGIAPALFAMPWCFKGFYGLLIDRVPFCGTRRKGWIIFGWTGAIAMIIVLALFCDQLVDEHAFVSYIGIAIACCCFYMFSEVAGDGLSVELSRLEPEENRGSILVTGQMIRYASGFLANLLGFFTMNGGEYCGNICTGHELPFHVDFRGVHFILVGLSLPLYVLMIFTLKDPPAPPGGHPPHESLKETLGKIWQIFQTRSMLSVIVLSTGIYGISGIGNPAGGAIAAIVKLTTVWVSVAGLFGTILFVVGVWVFKTCCLRRNWRMLTVIVGIFLLFDSGFTFITIYNVGGFGQDAWFVSLGPSVWIADVVNGFKWQIMGLAVLEIAPPGLEATTLEIYCAIAHGAGTMAATIKNTLIPIFHINEISYWSYHNASPSVRDQYNTYMMHATVFSSVFGFVSLLAFVSFQPQSKEETRLWNKQWHTRAVGVTGIALATVTFLYALIVSILDIIPATACHRFLGGSGCV